MHRKRLLILGVAKVQMDAILAANDLGYETFAIAAANDGPGACVAHHFEILNFTDLEAVHEFAIRNKIDVIYSVGSDIAMPVASSISEELKLPHFVDYETARKCNRKDLMRIALGKGFVGNAKFQIYSNTEDELTLPYPVIVKPADSQGQRGVKLVENFEQLVAQLPTSISYSPTQTAIVEEYLDGPEISANGYLVDGELVFLQSSDRETWPGFFGLVSSHVIPASMNSDEFHTTLHHRMSEASDILGIHNGPVYAQIKVVNGAPFIVEITPRLDGCHMWRLIKAVTGIDLLRITLRHLVEGLSPTTEETHPLQVESGRLDFICEEPGKLVDMEILREHVGKSENLEMYYDHGQMIRPINGRFEKIGYVIRPLKTVKSS